MLIINMYVYMYACIYVFKMVLISLEINEIKLEND